jgi:putative transposase
VPGAQHPLLARAPGAAAEPVRDCGDQRAGRRCGAPFYAFPAEVRRILYTTNAIEALNAKLRSAVRARGHFPTDEAALKLLYLVLNRTEREWRMPPREWAMAKAQFAVLFGQRFTRALA